MGRIHIILFVFLQELSRRICIGQFAITGVCYFRFENIYRVLIFDFISFFNSYSVGPPSFQDTIQKEFVFKLSFKNHVYFFRADSEHTYNRWMEVLRSTTQTQDFKNTRGTH